jgi:tetratricopeptide (TPR) repeat protein
MGAGDTHIDVARLRVSFGYRRKASAMALVGHTLKQRNRVARAAVRCSVGLAALAAVSVWVAPARASDTDPPAPTTGVVRHGLVFDNPQAAELHDQARQWDPMFCPAARANRDKAIAAYEQAMAAQPQAGANVVLARRIAQLYAFYEHAGSGVKPDPIKAARWWQRAIQLDRPEHLTYAQSHMGLASARMMAGGPGSALVAYEKLLDLDPEAVEVPDWVDLTEEAMASGMTHEAYREQERQRTRQRLGELQKQVVNKIGYAAARLPQDQSIAVLRRVAEQRPGSPVAQEASKRLVERLGSNRNELDELPTALLLQTPPRQADVQQEAAVPQDAAPAGIEPAQAHTMPPQDRDPVRRNAPWPWWAVAGGATALIGACSIGWWAWRHRIQTGHTRTGNMDA